MTDSIRVAICDDHGVVRAGLRALLSLEPDIDVVGEVGSGEEALGHVREWQPDVVLMDISLPGMDGLEATRQIHCALPACHVLVLTVHKQAHYLLEAMKAGASGYVVKSDVDHELLDAIRAIYRGNAFVQSEDTRIFFQAYLESGGPIDVLRLSPTERQVLKLTAQGNTVREIGETLAISPNSVGTYRKRIMEKLGIEKRSQLVRWAQDHGLIPPGACC